MSAGKPLPVLRVVGAVWRRHQRVFLAQRPEGKSHAGLWEFPGGKQELGERAKQALAREAVEELGVSWRVGPEWACVEEHRDGLRLKMRMFQVHSEDQPQGLEGQEIGWFSADELDGLPMPPMDALVRQRLQDELRRPELDLWEQSFAWVRGIGDRVEHALWRAGVRGHTDFNKRFEQLEGIESVIAREQVIRIKQNLSEDHNRTDAERWDAVPARHRWRLLEAWRETTTALDFECDRSGAPTVMGVSDDGSSYTAFVDQETMRWWLDGAAESLPGRWTSTGADSGLLDGLACRFQPFEAAPKSLRRDGLILVFGGRKFDVSMLRKVYDGEPLPERFGDLLDLARRAKRRGGLKAVERALGIARATRIADLRGRDAITLWARVEAGGEQAFWAFADLVAYNRADTVNLFELRDRLLLDLSDRLGMPDWFVRVAKNESS
jgi:8-oxo-dGTP diphosphatase